jgi:hypothetical protein
VIEKVRVGRLNMSAAQAGIAPDTTSLRILERDANHMAFTCDRLFVMNWRVSTNLEAVKRCSQLIKDFAESFLLKRIALLTVIELEALMPSSPARTELAKLMRRNTPYLVRSAVGYEGTGFRGAAFRGASTGIALLSNHQFPHRIFAGVPAATDWLASGLASELNSAVTGKSLAAIVNKARTLPPQS